MSKLFRTPPKLTDESNELTQQAEGSESHHYSDGEVSDSFDSVSYTKTEGDEVSLRKLRSGKKYDTQVYYNLPNLPDNLPLSQTNPSDTMAKNNDLNIDIFHVKDDIKFTGKDCDTVDIHSVIDECEASFIRRNVTDDLGKIAIFSSKISKERCPASNLLKSDKIAKSKTYNQYKTEFLRKFSGQTHLEGISSQLHKVVDLIKKKNTPNTKHDDIVADVSIVKKTFVATLDNSQWVDNDKKVESELVGDLFGYVIALCRLEEPVLRVAKTIPYEKGSHLLDYIDIVDLQCSKAGIPSKETHETVAVLKPATPSKTSAEQRQSRSVNKNTSFYKPRGNTPFGSNRNYRSRSNSIYGKTKSQPNVMCYYCANTGHKINQCYIKRKEDNDKIKGNNPYCRFHKCIGHWTADCNNVRKAVNEKRSGEGQAPQQKDNT